ncbi:poly-gamma-glutamate synthesis protein (capsule biosynthesis protein) [Branchiibius hedensis]|uniref:Poly-gamma-glutamate synthesis protein (Capsule biosynthesis protein) n=1 Tax=Branchiibius hedensis TaxID=672460 RepID=A0A2Y9BUM7_9MICO|nr:CapA family protein [Branchiibius hedensis]PWJ27161.1 poly-gamma-glutamate synthesis protein (capsule biosynthesis protein) [Branchiibius hedensis]SSA35972.1 poly-gamma-glutamate synthesis protein (capsule biosynthesis protein) [Branchiibius hedensis]
MSSQTPKVPVEYSAAFVGDIIITQPILQLLQRDSTDLLQILEQADLVVGNFEGSIVDLHTFTGHPAAQSGFGWLNSPPEVAADLAGLGFHLLSRANNHSTDWGHEGLRSTDDHLRAAGLRVAGTGATLSAARAPVTHDGPAARSALVSCTTTFEGDTPAEDPLGQVAGRPGASTIGLNRVALVTPEQLEQLRSIRDAQVAHLRPDILLLVDQLLEVVTLFDQQYAALPEGAAQVVDAIYRMDEQDLAGVLLNVRQARQTADYVVAAVHAHEPNNWATQAPSFLRDLARQAVANGADVVVGHGPHQLRGIEWIDGRPAFYSLGNFCFMDNAQPVVTRSEWERRIWRLSPAWTGMDPRTTTPAEFLEWQRVNGVFGESVWFESVIPVVRYRADGCVEQIVLRPIELRYDGRDAERGIPRVAPRDIAVRILQRLARLSEPLGTRIEIDEATGQGVIDGITIGT